MSNHMNDRSINVKGAMFHGDVRARDVSADVTVSVGSDTPLQSAVDRLAQTLGTTGLLERPDLAELVDALRATVEVPDPEPGAVRGVLALIEKHPALAQGLPAAVGAALQGLQMLVC
jgi:hypothetical protein